MQTATRAVDSTATTESFGYAEWTAIMDGRFRDVTIRRHGWERFRTVIVGQSPAMARVLEQVDQVAATDSTVLLLGETGTGKELFATQIHELSARRGRPHGPRQLRGDPGDADRERAVRPREGRVYRRAGAADRPLRAGRPARRSSSTRSATCRRRFRSSCCACSRSGRSSGWKPASRFASTRESSRPRIGISSSGSPTAPSARTLLPAERLPDHVPPLRERVEDIPLLVWRFVEEFSKAFGKRIDAIRGTTWRRCNSTRGPATSASCATSSSAR